MVNIPVAPEVAPPEIPYHEFAAQKWSKFPGKVALIDAFTEETLTYAQLERKVRTTAGRLQKLGVKSQTPVQFYADNCMNAVLAQNAAYFCNAIVFAFKPNKTTKYEEYKYQVEDSRVEFVLTDGVNYDVSVHQLLQDPDCQVKKVVILNGMPKNPVTSSKVIFLENLDNHEYVPPQVKIKEDVLVVSYTSGSTGKPKGVMHSHYTFISALDGMGPNTSNMIIDTDRFLLLSTLTYVTGIILSAGTFSLGATLILASHDIDTEIPMYVKRYNATTLCILEVPTRIMIDNSLKFPEQRQLMSSLRLVFVGGTVFPESLRRDASEFFKGAKIMNIYGMTESIGMISCSEQSDVFTADVGVPCVNCMIRIIATTGCAIEVGEVGELQFCSPQMTLGYWGIGFGKQDFTEDGWFQSGDLATVDDQGKIYIVGRLKLFIICLDERVSPTEIEDLIHQHPAVNEVIVVPLPHPVVQEAPTAVVVLKPGITATKKLGEEIVSFVASRTVENKHLHGGVFFVQHLDKTESGKYARKSIKERAEILKSGRTF